MTTVSIQNAGLKQVSSAHDLRHRVLDWFFRRQLRSVEASLCEPGALPVRGIHRILICRPNHRLGNAMLISPLLEEVEKVYPGAEIDIVCGGQAAQSLYSCRFTIRHIYCLPRKIARHLVLTIGLLRQLRLSSYDLAIDACVGSQSGRLLLGWVRARYKVGFPRVCDRQRSSAWHVLEVPPHLAKRNVFLLRSALGTEADLIYPLLDMRLSAAERHQGRQALEAILGAADPSQPRTVIGVFTNATGAKCYDEDWWRRFLSALQLAHRNVLFVDILAEHGRSPLDGDLPSFYTRDVRKLAAVISNMDCFISADCGVMHVAAASGVPTIGLFSVTDMAKYAPYGVGNAAIDTRDKSAAEVASMAAHCLTTRAD